MNKITQVHIGEARANAQNFNDFNLDSRDNFRLQYILTKISLLQNNFTEDIFNIILNLREGNRITEKSFNDLIKWIWLLNNTKLDNISETKREIIDFLNNISGNIIELNSKINEIINETKDLADAWF